MKNCIPIIDRLEVKRKGKIFKKQKPRVKTKTYEVRYFFKECTMVAIKSYIK